MSHHVLNHQNGKSHVLTFIMTSVQKCVLSLGMNMSIAQVKILCQDIYEVYSSDSVEDVQECLRRGRMGEYDFGHFKRDILCMPLFRTWMSLHLEKKSKTREDIITNRKHVIEKIAPVTDEIAKEYLAKIKANLKAVIDGEKAIKPAFTKENIDSFWLKELNKVRKRRLLMKLIMKRVERGETLSTREVDFLAVWNIKI
jgi:hypothetical protein